MSVVSHVSHFQWLANENGLSDSRSDVCSHMLQYIFTKHPNTFILENVPALVHLFPETFNHVVTFLRGMTDASGQPVYVVHWRILDTRMYLPQRRRRLYIIGLKRAAMVGHWAWPKAVGPALSLGDVLEEGLSGEPTHLTRTKIRNISCMLDVMKRKPELATRDLICDVGGSKLQFVDSCSPCLTASRCSDLGYFSTLRHRILSIVDLMRLQGVQPETFPAWELHLSTRQMGHIVGTHCTLSLSVSQSYWSLCGS